MEDAGNRLVIIAVGLLSTLSIVTVVNLIVSGVEEVYAKIKDVDISIIGDLYEYDRYGTEGEKKTLSGVDLRNAMNRYKNNNGVEIYVNGAKMKKFSYFAGRSDAQAAWNAELDRYCDSSKYDYLYTTYSRMKPRTEDMEIYFTRIR